ncbi:hypothetical protein SKAU_G00014120 [Synaphobranchus kaupii]|uniref:Ubiquitin-like-conjugating enzyme ATG10 n=1 Tax=Synaphobranchus kaupii TaxID=118154 RepID=A0A9Q1GBU1_SYNKA|nr:hypothetical protein SKAU_G00014120 [Synaphobranchus kaupii]
MIAFLKVINKVYAGPNRHNCSSNVTQTVDTTPQISSEWQTRIYPGCRDESDGGAECLGHMAFSSLEMTGEKGKGAGALHLDEETFRRACRRFVQHSHALNDGWSWEEVKGSDEGYMRKSVLSPGGSAPRPARDGGSGPGEDLDILGQREGQELEDEDEEQAGSDEERVVSETSSPIRYEYHVLYSCSYQAPVLYFRASTLDGRPLSLEDMWDNVHPNYRQRLLQGPWDTITQQEHPLIGQSFFVLHPCRTQDLMRPILAAASAENRSLNYIVSWLSSVGPVAALTVPLSYAHIGAAPDLQPTVVFSADRLILGVTGRVLDTIAAGYISEEDPSLQRMLVTDQKQIDNTPLSCD